jgi:hypothetical protein
VTTAEWDPATECGYCDHPPHIGPCEALVTRKFWGGPDGEYEMDADDQPCGCDEED